MKNKIFKAGIVNVTGYAGVEVARLLARHPEVELVAVSARSAAGKKLQDVFPHLTHNDLDITADLADVDIAFLALPHQESAVEAPTLLARGIKVIDLSADFRLKDPELYPQWYHFTHPELQLLTEAVYGLPELNRKAVAAARLVANPGCYPTSVILALAPALEAGFIGSHVIVDSKSGLSGAGRSLNLASHFCEADENTSAYALTGHRHQPEMEQEISRLAGGRKAVLTFVPHLVPMTRGILSTIYAPLTEKLAASPDGIARLKCAYRDFYAGEPFVRITDTPPGTKHTWGSNLCLIYPTIDLRAGRVIIVSALDNLGKGAAGQAVQNMNLLLGLPETAGLEAIGVWP